MDFVVKRLKKVFAICLLLLLTIPFGALYAVGSGSESQSSEPVATVYVVPNDTAGIEVGETFLVYVLVGNVENLYGFDVEFAWNPTVVEYVDHEVMAPVEDYGNGVLNGPVLLVKDDLNADSGVYTVACASMSPAEAFVGNGALFVFEFKLLSSSGPQSYGVTSVELSNDKGQPLLVSEDKASGIIATENVWEFIRNREKDPKVDGWLRWWKTQMKRRWGY
jgi:hypothetical protein